jgi:hypothetical protein
MSRILVLCVVLITACAAEGQARAADALDFDAARVDSVEIQAGARSATSEATDETRRAGARSATSEATDETRRAGARSATPDKSILKGKMASLGEVEVPGERQWQRRKSARVAVLSNMVLPGLGQVYNGRRLKAVTMVSLFSGYVARAWIEDKKKVRRRILRDQYPIGSIEWKFENLFVDFHRETKRDYAWWAGAIYLLGMIDAFVDAHLFDVRSVDPTIIEGTENQHYVGFSAHF